MQSSPVLTSLIALLAAAPPGERAPERAPSRGGGPSRPAADSTRTVREARRAQEQFESLRRANLPFRPGGSSGQCDVQIGRLCYWHDDDEPPAEVPEPDRIARGRDRLLAVLDEAARQLKGDDWIAGQRVRYLIDARRNEDAVTTAAACQATSWWCAALTGLALHQAGRYDAADSAFAAALGAMPEKQRCAWTDISLFLEGDAARWYGRLPCADRAAIERRFWWLSQPLHSMSGNDARTEFFARRTMSRLLEHARSAHNMSWGRDVDELLVRYGWSTWWTRDHPSGVSASPGPPAIVGHGPTPSFAFHPAARLVGDTGATARPEDWQPRARRPLARYAPSYAASFSEVPTQVAVFRRGDTAVVVAAHEQPTDSLFRSVTPEASLVLAPDETSPATVARRDAASQSRGALVARAQWRPMLVSVELRAPVTRGVARARFGLRPDDGDASTGRLALSDILLYEPADGAGGSLEEVTRYALGSARVQAGGRVGAYWELYGVRAAGEQVSVTLTVERVGVGWAARAAERLGLAAKVTPLSVRWQEVPSGDAGVAARAIRIDLSTLPAGRYRMVLSVATGDGSTARRERAIELTPAR